MRVVLNRQPDHLHSLHCGGSARPVRLVRRIAAGHEKNGVQTQLKAGVFTEDQMTDMDRIKGAAHDSFFLALPYHFSVTPFTGE